MEARFEFSKVADEVFDLVLNTVQLNRISCQIIDRLFENGAFLLIWHLNFIWNIGNHTFISFCFQLRIYFGIFYLFMFMVCNIRSDIVCGMWFGCTNILEVSLIVTDLFTTLNILFILAYKEVLFDSFNLSIRTFWKSILIISFIKPVSR